MESYQHGSGTSLAGIAGLTVCAVLGGAVIGFATFAVSHVLYLIIIFPIGMGIGAGGIVYAAVRVSRVPNRLVAASCGILIGLTSYGVMYYSHYVKFRHGAHAFVAAKMKEKLGLDAQAAASLDTRVVDDYFDLTLEEETGSTGFWGFMKLTASMGIEMRGVFPRLDGSFDSDNLGMGGTWALWVVELTVISVIALLFAINAAGKPFCARCRSWYSDERFIGSVPERLSERFVELVIADGFSQAGELVVDEHLPAPAVGVAVQECSSNPNCDRIVTVRVSHYDSENRFQSEQLLKGVISADQHSDLVASIRHQRVADDAESGTVDEASC